MTREEILEEINQLSAEDKKWIAESMKKKKKSKNPLLFKLAKERFCMVYFQIRRVNYYWTAKDSGCLTQLCDKIECTLRDNGKQVDEIAICNTLEAYMRRAYSSEAWIANHFDLGNLNSQFNTIYSRLINGTQGTSSIPRDYAESILRGC